ncbi:MAG TPA: type ISP restriction/modification enzyme [Caulobacteraceae bacterium]
MTDIFPWQQPGCKFGRTWPIAPASEVLTQRWERFAAAAREEKAELFVTASSGRNTTTQVDGYRRLADVQRHEDPEPIVRYGYRSFDRQWVFNDPRLANLERPSLWQSTSERQVYLSSLLTGEIGTGPALTASAYVPDLHFFRGSHGGKDMIPLWRDAAFSEPNLTEGLAVEIGRALGIDPPTVEEIGAYVYALLSTSAYQARFAEALRTPGLRVPITADANLWAEVTAAGRRRLWLHTYAERFRDPAAQQGSHIPLIEGVEWEAPVTRMPMNSGEIEYDGDAMRLTIGDGVVVGVRPEVWAFEVSGMPAVSKWLGYRTRQGAGRAASSSSALDRIRPETWSDDWNDELLDLIRVLTLTLDEEPALADLLERVCDGPLIEADRLPTPSAPERQPPATRPRASAAAGG